jgi:hypothetical protein
MSALRVNSGTVPRTQRLRLRGRFPRTRQRAALLSERRGDHGRDRSVRREGARQLRLLSQALRRRLAEAGGTSQTYRGRWPQTCKYLTGIGSKLNKSLIAGCYAWPNRGNSPKPPREYGNPSISTRRVSAWRGDDHAGKFNRGWTSGALGEIREGRGGRSFGICPVRCVWIRGQPGMQQFESRPRNQVGGNPSNLN